MGRRKEGRQVGRKARGKEGRKYTCDEIGICSLSERGEMANLPEHALNTQNSRVLLLTHSDHTLGASAEMVWSLPRNVVTSQ